MTKCHPARRYRVSATDRQMLAAAYVPVIAFGVVLIVAQTLRPRRHHREAGPR